MNLDEINPVDKIKKSFNTFKNGFKGKSKEGFSNDELSTEENAYLSNIHKHPKFAVNAQLANTVNVGYADINGGVKVKITFEKLDEENTNATKTRKVTGLTITNTGTEAAKKDYKVGDTIVITTDKIKDKSDTADPRGIYIDEAKAKAEQAGNNYVGSEDNALRFTITDTTENDWENFVTELITLFILLILFSIIGANIVHLSNLPMGALDSLLPSDWNMPPYRGEYLKGASLFKKLRESETREDLLEFLFPMKSVAFPYTYDSMYRNDELDDLGLAFYVIWPLKWLARTTAWAWSTARLLIKYFIAFLKWIMTYIKSDSLTFFLGPFLLMFALSTQLTTIIGTILMYIGGFMTDVKDGWVLAIFALIIFVIALAFCCAGCVHICPWCCKMLSYCVDRCLNRNPASPKIDKELTASENAAKAKAQEVKAEKGIEPGEKTASSEDAPPATSVMAGIAGALPISAPPRGIMATGEEGGEWRGAINETFKGPGTFFESTVNSTIRVFNNLLSGGTTGLIPESFKRAAPWLFGIVIIFIAVFSMSFSSAYNSANGFFMTIQFTVFSLINLLFKNNGIALMKEIISKHIKGLTIVFLLFSFAMARGNLTTNISNSYIFAGIIVIISIIFSMFKKDKE